jgi:hypothetical protein
MLLSSVEKLFGALAMKAFKDLFGDMSGAEYAIAVAAVIAVVMIIIGADRRSTSNEPGAQCCGLDRFEAYRGPRA